jgi:hypothetical protein
MARSKTRLLEREVNRLLAGEMRDAGFLVLQELRLHPCEMDVVLFDPRTLKLANFEIKRTNWRAVLSQAVRATLYCHFSIAVLPATLRNTAPVDEFHSRGIGLIFYEERDGKLDLSVANHPSVSTAINRPLKQLVYRQFHAEFGDLVYA